jgi:hypothetical protein
MTTLFVPSTDHILCHLNVLALSVPDEGYSTNVLALSVPDEGYSTNALALSVPDEGYSTNVLALRVPDGRLFHKCLGFERT